MGCDLYNDDSCIMRTLPCDVSVLTEELFVIKGCQQKERFDCIVTNDKRRTGQTADFLRNPSLFREEK